MPSKKILIISFTPSHPIETGTRARTHALSQRLKELGYQVHFLHVPREAGNEAQMRQYWGDQLHLCSYREPVLAAPTLMNWFTKKFTGIDRRNGVYGVDDWYDQSLDSVLDQLARRISFDIVIAQRVFISKALTRFDKKIVKIIDTQDILSDRHLQFLRAGHAPNWFSTTKKQEKRALARANLILAIHEGDSSFFASISDKPIVTVGHVTPLAKTAKNFLESKEILFVGSRGAANEHGINFFIREVFPKILLTQPTAKLLIAGSIGKAALNGEGIHKLGVLEDLRQTYERAEVVINPVSIGTGLKIKSIEALGYAKPLVTTANGMQGIEDGSGTSFLLADTADEFAQQVLRVLTDQSCVAQLSERALAYAKNWNEKQLKAFDHVF